MNNFDFSHLNTAQTDQQNPNDFDFSHLNSDNTPNKPQGVNTFLGNLLQPGSVPEFNQGTPENKSLIENLINTFGGAPGMDVLGKGLIDAGKAVGTAFRDISPLEQKAIDARQQYENTGDQEQAVQQQGAASGLPQNADSAQAQLFNNQQKLNDLHESLADQPPALPKDVDEAKDILDKNQQTHEDAKNLSDETEDQLSKHLNKGVDYDVEAASKIKQIEQANRRGISKGYDDLENDWANREVKIDNTQKIQDKNNELMDVIKSGGARSPEANNILSELDNLKSEKSVSAKDYLQAYRSVSQYAREARQKAYQPGMNAEERAEWKQKYDTLDSKVDEMGSTLEDSVGKDEFGKLKGLNDRWRNEVVPLHQNRIYQNIVRKGTISDNMIKSLRGTDKGNVILRNIVKNDPELLKNVVGQRYAIKPSEVLNPNDRMKEYSDLMTDMNQLRDQHLAAKEVEGNSKEALKDATQAHDEISKNAQKYADKRQKIEDTQNNLALLDKHVENLRQVASRKDLSLSEKIKAEKNYAQAKKAQKDARYKLRVGGYVTASLGGLGGLRYVGKLLSNNQPSIENKEGE